MHEIKARSYRHCCLISRDVLCRAQTSFQPSSFDSNRNGRIDDEKWLHDDTVIGWLLAHWLLTCGKLLSVHGIDDHRIGSALNAGGQETTVDRQRRRAQQAIQDELSREPDEWVAARTAHHMQLLDRRIMPEEDEIFGMDTPIYQAKAKKR